MEMRLAVAQTRDDILTNFDAVHAESDVRHGRREREADIAEPDDANVTIRILVGYGHELSGSEADFEQNAVFHFGLCFRA